MKILWIAGSLSLVSLSCQREEEASSGTTAAAAPKVGKTASLTAGEQVPGEADEKATKSKQRPAIEKKKVWVAEPVADQPGFVKSPFSGTIIDVRGIPAGTLVADPTFPSSDQKHFRVPEMPEDPEEELKKAAPVARSLPGKEGFIFSPYDNKIIDANGIEPGTVIEDPTAPAGAKRYIKIPSGLPPEMDSIDGPFGELDPR